ncbi:MAG: hypothetical protein AAGF12_19535 [Myxococcota bacterium]
MSWWTRRIVRSLSLFLLVGGCSDLTPELPYDPESRAINTGEVLPEISCGVAGETSDGFSCECSEECRSGFCFAEEDAFEMQGFGIPGGLCVLACANDGECEPGYACLIPPGLIRGVCSIRCEGPDDCPPANLCESPFDGTPQVCNPYCQSDEECRGGFCDRWTGSCGATSDPELGGLGFPCEGAAPCRGRICLNAGFCSATCSVSRQGCPDNGVCVENGSGQGVCLPPCLVDEDCAPYPDATCSFWESAQRRACI